MNGLGKIPSGEVVGFEVPDAADVGPSDPKYADPNLYDITLTLNSDPGLDAWWSNVAQVLCTHYGAERASLAVPGDATDLENVPWGQKATYFKAPLPSTDAHGTDSLAAPKCGDGDTITGLTRALSAKRPKLMARHSFAGYGKYGEPVREPSSSRQGGLQRRRSANDKQRKLRSRPKSNEGLDEAGVRPPSPTVAARKEEPQPPTPIVYPAPRALDVEEDPLIDRTGVVELFGRTKPTVLTREFAVDTPHSTPHQDVAQTTPRADTPHQFTGGATPSDVPDHDDQNESSQPPKRYEDYEQIPPSPWSQSPAPSPAPLRNSEHNPFFATPQVDEGAFASSPPPCDYSESKNFEAIGVDRAKSAVHIPLLHSRASNKSALDTLRFPIAVVSFLSPVIPYPSRWRASLAHLLPLLTASYCLAQHHSQLEKRLSSTPASRYGHILGLGGTFSDASSELELVAGLSGHVNYPLGEETGLSTHPSPSVGPNMTGSSSVMSMAGVLNSDISNAGLRNEFFLSPGGVPKHGSDLADGYFKQGQPNPGKGGRSSGLSSEQSLSIPTSPRDDDEAAYDELTSRDPGLVSAFYPPDGYRPSPNTIGQHATPTRASLSTTTQLHRDMPARPFPDTIAQLMLNSIPLHLFLAKPRSGEIIWTNTKFDSYRKSESRVRDPWQGVHESEREHIEAEWAKVLKTGSQITERVRVQAHDMETCRWFIFRANPLLSGTGEVLYWIGSFLDVHEQHITEIKAAKERELFATEAKYRALSNSIPQVVFEAAEYRGLISANEQWHLYTGQSLEEAQNFGFAQNIHREDLEKCGIVTPPRVIPDEVGVPEFSHIIANSTTLPVEGPASGDSANEGESVGPFGYGVTLALTELARRKVVIVQQDENGRDSYTTEIRFRSRKGEFRWHLVRLVKVENPFGNGEASWYGTCTDINDRKILERELNNAMYKLNNEMESKTKFFSNMSHEIRTPLNGILGTIPFILETQLDNDQRRMLDTIQNSSTNLRELVDNILDVSRVEAGKMNIVPQWFHVRSMLEDVMDTIGSRAIDKGLELNYLVDVDVPAMVMGDRFRIRQILINLVGNAVKFTSQGEIYTRCSIYAEQTARTNPSEILLHFEVVDTGKGFSSTDAERLMQRFSQIESNGSQQHAGSGLGLFLSKQLVEMHGGRLTPTSKEGRGAKFSFFVKIIAQPPHSAPAAGKRKLLAAALPTLQPTDTQGIVKQDLVESPCQESFGASALTIPDHATSTQSESSYASISSLVSPGLVTSFPSTAASSPPKPERAQSDPLDGSDQPVAVAKSGSLDTAPRQKVHRDPYSVLIVCPFDYAREAIQQHIEQVIPLEVEAKVSSVLDVEDWRDFVNSGDCANLTHVILCVPDSNDVLEVMQHVLNPSPSGAVHSCSPTLVVVADLYLKRQIASRYEASVREQKKVYIVPKPVKPSAFAEIFDPDNERDLSKDRNQDMARELNNSFKTMSKLVKEVIGNKGYRVLLVEDDETNRTVSLKFAGITWDVC